MRKNRMRINLLFVLLVIIFTLSTNSRAKAFAASPQAQNAQAVIALEGLDPVLLVQGKETMGNMKISVTRGGFQYLFANEENKAAFEKSPELYEVQLDGTCARMGAQVQGNPDLYTVYQGHIYIFGSANCKKLFDASPEKYLEPTGTKEVSATPDAVKKGQVLIDKAAAAMGGVSKIDSITSYQATVVAVAHQQQGDSEFKTAITRLYPDRLRQEQNRSFGTTISVAAPGESFFVFKAAGNGQMNVRALSTAASNDLRRQTELTLFEVLRARSRKDFKVAFTGTETVEGVTTEQVAVSFDGLNLRLGIDPASGRILSLAYRGRNSSNGEWGDIVRTYSDFRSVEGLTIPFKTKGTFNGQPASDQNFAIEAISFNVKPDPAAFEKPKPTGAQ